MGLRRITEPYVLLCEGMHDAQFFSHFIREKNLPTFTISSCGHAADADGDGISFLTEALDELPSIPGFETVEAVLIVADNDSDPSGKFNDVVKMINATADIIGPPRRRYNPPNVPLAAANGNPATVVMMLPWTNTNGALDSLLYVSAANKRPAVAKCVEEFAKCARADVWPMTKQAKMRLRSFISASHHADPYLAPAWVWKEKTDLVPLDDPVFNQIETFIRDFPALVA